MRDYSELHSREYVEDRLLARFNRRYPDDVPDEFVGLQFKSLVPVFEVTMAKALRRTRIPSFTDDDLVSLMLAKAHQTLRRGQYDWERNPYSYYAVVFTMLVREIVRFQSRPPVMSMRWDVLDSEEPLEFMEERYRETEAA